MIWAITLESFSLKLSRISLMLAAYWAVLVVLRLMGSRPDRSVTIIPRPILWFGLIWNAIVAVILTLLLALDIERIDSGVPLTLYSQSLVWSTFGITWILARGSKEAVEAVNLVESLDRAITDIRKRKQEEEAVAPATDSEGDEK